jgi:LemA protein
METTRTYAPRKAWYAVPLAAIGIVALLVVFSYNGLVSKQQEVRKTWAEVENMLQRRSDLIPNLVNTVKGYAKHEEAIFEKLAEARKQLQAANGVGEKAAAATALNATLARVVAVAESTPELKANTTFQRLMDELAGSENRVAVARTRYNEAVREMNATVAKFPGSLTARLGSFPSEPYFEVASSEVRAAPKVNFWSVRSIRDTHGAI